MNNSGMLALLDRIDPFHAPADISPVSDGDVQGLSTQPGAQEALLSVIRDETATLARRYAAVEVLLRSPWTDWRRSPPDARAVARALTDAMAHDSVHNRWGLPGQFVGRLGKQLLSVPDGVTEALSPSLNDRTMLRIEGSEAATIQAQRQYRVADLAAYLLATHRGWTWEDAPDPSQRDEGIARLRARLR